MASTSRKPAAQPARRTVRERAGALVDGTAIESVLDRVLMKRLRPLRDDVVAARKAFAEQAGLRADAEVRAARAEDEAARLRIRVAELEQELSVTQRPRARWFRRRALVGQPQAS